MILLVATVLATRSGWDVVPDRPLPSDDELERLRAGEAVYRSSLERGLSTGLAFAVAEASVDEVWSHVLDFDEYVKFMPYVTSSETTSVQGDWHTWQMELTTMGVVTRYTVENHRYPDPEVLTWTMTPRGGTPLLGASGWWWLEPLEADPSRTLIVYATSVEVSWWVPMYIHDKAARRLPTMVELIRDRAER